MIAQYGDARTAKVRANREIALLSTIFTFAREWGLTEKVNPCARLRRNKETRRYFYAGQIVWDAVYAEAPPELKDAMDLAYLTDQRPANVLKASTADLNNGFLMVGQGKTEKRLRIRLHNGARPKAASEIDDISHASRLLDRSTQEMTEKAYAVLGKLCDLQNN